MKNLAIILSFLFLAILTLPLTAVCQVNWTAQNSGTDNTLYRVQFIDSQVGYCVGAFGTVLKTANGGTDWVDVSVQTEHPLRDLSFLNETVGWVVSGDADNNESSGFVWMTDNGGESWTQLDMGTTIARLGVSFVSETNGWACGANNGPWDIRATTDGGENWALQSGDGFGWVYDIDCLSDQLGYSAGLAYFPTATGFVLKTVDGGDTWTQLNLGVIPFLSGVQFLDADRGYAVGENGSVFITEDGGDIWENPDVGSGENLHDVAVVSSLMAWVSGANGTILYTDDGGINWISAESGTEETLYGISFVDSTTGWAVGAAGTILTTTPEVSVEPDVIGHQLQDYTLLQAYPNPFNATTTINFGLPEASPVSLTVYDIFGRTVQSLTDRQYSAGYYSMIWNAKDVPAGIYSVQMQAGEFASVRKVTLIR